MTDFGLLILSLLLPAIVCAALWLHFGGLYYLLHPGAELLDDAMRLGRASDLSLSDMLSRFSGLKSAEVRIECARLRKELAIRKTSTWEKMVFSANRRPLV